MTQPIKIYDGLDYDSNFAIAVSFDGTLTVDYDDLTPNLRAVEVIRNLWWKGYTIILWTCRQGGRLKDAVDFCESYDVPLDYVNTYPYRGGVKKINVDCFIDSLNIGGVDWDKVEDQVEEMRQKRYYTLLKR